MSSLVHSHYLYNSYSPQAHRTAPMFVEAEIEEKALLGNELSDSGADSESENEVHVAEDTELDSHTSIKQATTRTQSQTFSKELIVFYLFGKVLPRHDHMRSDVLKRRLAEVKQVYHNIPSILHFAYSTVGLDQIGVAASQPLPKDTVLGPYSGKYLTEDELSTNEHNQWLWEIHDQDGVSSYIDGSDPKFGNWMSLIQCARSSAEQNLKLSQQATPRGVQLYFVATCDIELGQELLVWYDKEHVELYFDLPLRLKEGEGLEVNEDGSTVIDTNSLTQESMAIDAQRSNQQADIHKSSSTCTDDSGVLSMDQDIRGAQNSTRESSPEEEFDTPQPPLLKPLTKEDTTLPQEAYTLPIKPTPQLMTTYTYIQPPTQLTTPYGYIGIRDPSYSPQPSPRRPAQWIGKQRSRSRSPAFTPTESAVESGDQWKTNTPKGQLLYGMFMRSEDGSRWKCVKCERQFNSQGSLRAHARIHTGERPYKCKFCSRTFCQASTLRSHERLHTGEKPYKCGVCGRAFTQSAGLRSHLKTHIGGSRME